MLVSMEALFTAIFHLFAFFTCELGLPTILISGFSVVFQAGWTMLLENTYLDVYLGIDFDAFFISLLILAALAFAIHLV